MFCDFQQLKMNDSIKLFNIESLCRICLTQSKKMILLSSPLNENEIECPTIIEALENIMGIKISCNKFPTLICPMCLGLLKISYDLKQQFLNSQELLQNYYKDNFDRAVDNLNESYTNDFESSPVELIVGPNKYDLKDLVIIEEEKKNESDFKGFLNNLGKTITAKFVKKVDKSIPKNTFEEPIVLIEKIDTKNDRITIANTSRKNQETKFQNQSNENSDKLIITPSETQDDTNIVRDPLNLEKFSLKDPSDTDLDYQNLFLGALNMQLKCKNCQKLYSSRGRYKRHIQNCSKLQYQMLENQKNKITVTTSPTLLGCHVCSRTFKQKKFLTYHLKTVHSTEPLKFTCEICGQVCRNRNALIYHKLKHEEKKFICDICGKKFLTSSTLKTHILNHTHRNVPQCICPVCGKTFHYKGGLFYHMKLHTNERKYCCELCDRRFYTLMSQKRHILTHTGTRPYACKFCEKRFFSTGEARKHEYLHTGYRPYRCQCCEKGFTSKYNLQVHLVSHPGTFACNVCCKTFFNANILQFHHRTKHSAISTKEVHLESNDSQSVSESEPMFC